MKNMTQNINIENTGMNFSRLQKRLLILKASLICFLFISVQPFASTMNTESRMNQRQESSDNHIHNVVQKVYDYEYGASRKALLDLEHIVNRVENQPDILLVLENELAALLQSERATNAAKQFVCQQLHHIPVQNSFPALTSLLQDDNTVEMACYALVNQGHPNVNQALLDALDGLEGNSQIAVINVLGERQANESVSKLEELAKSSDTKVAISSIRALGSIASDNSVAALKKIMGDRGMSDHHAEAETAYLHAAHRMAQQGEKEKAQNIFRSLLDNTELIHVRRGAFQGAVDIGKSGEKVVLFDGSSFDGWEGEMDMFRIEQNAVVAGNLEEDIPNNFFLCTEEEYDDFILTLKVCLRGGNVNGGIQFRSQRIPNSHEVKGYQADVGGFGESENIWKPELFKRNVWGSLYDESRRKEMLSEPDEDYQNAAMKKPKWKWNEYEIRCVGRHIQIYLNGHQMVDYKEPDSSIPQEGIIGLQIHAGGPGEVWYKDVVLQEIQ